MSSSDGEQGRPIRTGGARDAARRSRTNGLSPGLEPQYRSLFEDSPISLWEEDFAEVKKLIESLRRSGVRDFREYFAKNPDVVADMAGRVKVVEVNRATLELFKARTVEEFRGGLGVVFAVESYDTFREELIAIAEGESRFEAETVNKTLDGETRQILLTWSVPPGYEETLSRVFVSIIDVTERKRAERALQESEERFRKLSEAAFEGIAIHDRGRILDANRALAAMFGYELSEVVGMTASQLTAPESRDLVSTNILTGYEQPYEIVGLRKDGTTFPVETCGKAIRFEGRLVRVAAMRDITERKQAEEMLQRAREEIEGKIEPHASLGTFYGLTFRELTVLYLMATGKSDREIGVELGISHLTVQKHVAHILEKMGASSRTEASVRAIREGLVA